MQNTTTIACTAPPQIILNHPTRPDVEATLRADENNQVAIEVGIVKSPLFRIVQTASTDVELYDALGLLVDTGFFDRRDLLMALRWTQWFSPEQIHDESVRRAAEVIGHLRQITHQSIQRPNHDRYKRPSRRKSAG